jgi:hypothetical protein
LELRDKSKRFCNNFDKISAEPYNADQQRHGQHACKNILEDFERNFFAAMNPP